jgi:TrmH family RNA methyltransferase
VLINPSSHRNVGTIVRTMLGFGFADLAVISPIADIFHPKVGRSPSRSVVKGFLDIRWFFIDLVNDNNYRKPHFKCLLKHKLGLGYRTLLSIDKK